MLAYILLMPIVMSAVVCITHRPTVIYTKCTTIHRKWVRLKLLVSSTETDTYAVYSVSAKIVLQLIHVEILKWFKPDSVKKLGKNIYELSYDLNNKQYKMLLTPYRGPRPVLQIIDDKNNDVTDIVLPYMGPRYDWHGHPISPSFFNTKYLTINWSDGTTENLQEGGDGLGLLMDAHM